MEAFDVEARVPGGPNAAWRARRLVESELGGRVPETVLPDIALLVTELVANGVRHGGAHEGAAVDVRFAGRGDDLHVEVVNAEQTGAKIGRRKPDLARGGGLGLHIVERLSSRWGVREEPRTVVWFELDCSSGGLL